ncbi:hypothetical protein OG555_20870 [Kribbella sp. NBC_01484]|uniref:hypothetical protein n=1 Tax=Kribbella sp. NBC_01484 TaxID=2903579 RepID=UPI002E318FCD|nr:hypothetical protein [Kribbella sp. NBC_01484]
MSPQYPQDPNRPPPGYVLKKKTHKFRNFVVLPFVGLIALIVVISVAASGGGGGTSPSASTDDSSVGAPQTRNDPRQVTPGKAFTIGKHTLARGWKVDYQEFGGSQVVGTVTNTSKSTSTAFFSIKFLKGATVLANFNCSTEELEPNQSQAVECYNSVTTTKRVTGWDKVTAEATL